MRAIATANQAMQRARDKVVMFPAWCRGPCGVPRFRQLVCPLQGALQGAQGRLAAAMSEDFGQRSTEMSLVTDIRPPHFPVPDRSPTVPSAPGAKGIAKGISDQRMVTLKVFTTSSGTKTSTGKSSAPWPKPKSLFNNGESNTSKDVRRVPLDATPPRELTPQRIHGPRTDPAPGFGLRSVWARL